MSPLQTCSMSMMCSLSVRAATGDASGQAITAACYPSDFDECLSVTALDEDGSNATFSDYNAAKDISAPGVNILSTNVDGGYSAATGSSMSAPIVSGQQHFSGRLTLV